MGSSVLMQASGRSKSTPAVGTRLSSDEVTTKTDKSAVRLRSRFEAAYGDWSVRTVNNKKDSKKGKNT
jgi:hypothetical protein